MNFISLFSGIGGLDLGLERAGMTCVGQVEIDPYCRAVLAKHWPGVPRHDDIRTWEWDGTEIDLVCGGVPCQPASCAGKRKGATDERWLWGEFLRVVSEVGPAWVLAENVRGFLSLPDSAQVFDQLEALGYEVGTLVLGAHHVGAPHKRDRVWIVAHAVLDDAECHGLEGSERRRASGAAWQEASIGSFRWPARPGEPQHEWEAPRLVYAQRGGIRGNGRRPSVGAKGEVQGIEEKRQRIRPDVGTANDGGERAVGVGNDADCEPALGSAIARAECGVGIAEPGVGSATTRFPGRLAGFARRNALRALGNAVVPAVAEVVGRAIMEAAE